MSRKKRKPIDVLRTKVWYECIRVNWQLNNANQMANYYGRIVDKNWNKNADKNADKNWYKYESGERVPTLSTLAEVESKVKGSRTIFDNGPDGSSLWAALTAPHSELWAIVDVSFPQHKAARKAGILGLMQYAHFLDNELILGQYKSNIDYLSHSKGLQKNAIELALERNELTIDYKLAATIIVFWRFSALVIYNMMNADYLLAGLISAFNKSKINNDSFEPLIGEFLKVHLLKTPVGE